MMQPTQGSLARSDSSVQRPRPQRLLSRRDSEREAPLNAKVFEDRWQSGPFADVPSRRSNLGLGPKVFTFEHKQLIARMRLEGARLSQELAEARRKIVLMERREADTGLKLQNLKLEVKSLQRYIESLKSNMRDATQAYQDLDTISAIASNAANLRLSRRLSHAAPMMPDITEPQSPPKSP